MAVALQDWSAGHELSQEWWHALGTAGPWALAGLFLLLVARAALRSRRYRAVDVLSEADRELVHEALRAAEQRTVGEIVPVVVERSDRHPAANWIGALTALVVGSAMLAPHLPWDRPALFFGAQLALAAVGWAVVRALPDLKHTFLREGRATEVAQEQALQLTALYGKILFFAGLPPGQPSIRFDSNTLHYRLASVHGTYGSTLYQNRMAMRLIASGFCHGILDSRFPIEEIDGAFRHAISGKTLKASIEP